MRRLALIALAGILSAACAQVDPAAELAAAEESYLAGDYRTAGIRLANVLQADPRNPEARALRGRLALVGGDFQTALADLNRAVDLGVPSEDVALDRAEALIGIGDAASALAALDEWSAQLDGDPRYWTLRGNALASSGRLDESAAAYEQSRSLGDESAANLIGRAQLALRRNDPGRAQVLLDEAARAAPTDPDVRSARGSFYLSQGRLEEGAAELRAAVEAFGSRPMSVKEAAALAALVQVELALDNAEGARSAAQRLSSRAPDAPISAYSQALVAYDDGRFSDAARLAQTAVNGQGDNPQFLTLLAAAQLSLGNLGQAEQHLLNALAIAPQDAAATKLLAETRLRQQRPEAALDVLQPLAGTDPGTDAMMALASLRAGRVEDAVETLERAVARNDDNDALKLELARAYLVAGREEEAARLIEESFGADDSEPALAGEVLLLLNDMQAERVDAGRARAERLAETFSEREDVLLLVASYYQRIGDLGSAMRHAQEAVRVASGSEVARLHLARLLAAQNDWEAVRATLEEGLAEREGSLPLRAALAEAELRLGNLEGAIRLAGELQRDHPSEPAGFLLEAEARLVSMQYDHAVEGFAAAYALSSTWPVLTRQAAALRLAGREAELEGLLADWVERNPQHVDGLLQYAMYLQNAGKPADAAAQYEQVVRLDEDNVIALNNLAWLRHESNSPNALELAERAQRAAPDNPAVLDTLGWILAEQGREAEAIGYLERAAELAPEALEIRYHLAQTQVRLGRTSDARATLEALLAEQQPFRERAAAEAMLESL